ncbi:MAG: LysR family transcriptional regulator [Cyanobacteria bacterium SZAS LIN-3]|nr:LysR family transcriptional regulator [Cyanobacteria bacterium SZAS LIN-3]MBS2008402.1 LysR family transcriptional regulator [Cyanobacteria bacterium SZAS TMP-1]
MELRHLRYFSVLAEELHFGRAAQRLNIAQPPLSQQIQALERELGVRLFDRQTRKVALTDAGKKFQEDVRTILASLNQAITDARLVQAGQLGTLEIGFVTAAANSFLPDLLRVFRQTQPRVRINLHELPQDAQLKQLRAGVLDLACVYAPLQDAALTSTAVAVDDLYAVLPADHRLAKKPRIAIGDLKDEPIVLFPRELGASFYDQIISLFTSHGFSPTIVQDITSFNAQMSLVASGIGLSIYPGSIRNMQKPGIVYRPIIGGKNKVHMILARRAGESNASVDSFVATVKKFRTQC